MIIVESAIPTMESVAPVSAPVFDEPKKSSRSQPPEKSAAEPKSAKPSKPAEPAIKTKKDLDARKTDARPAKGKAKFDDNDPRLF